MNYMIEQLEDLAAILDLFAKHRQDDADALKTARGGATALRMSRLLGERDAYLHAARTARACILSNPPIEEEYATAYAEAQGAAATQVWTSMRLHDGDPRWIFVSPDTGYRGEALS